jgi:hypothetical protein
MRVSRKGINPSKVVRSVRGAPAIDRHLLALHQTRRDALLYDALKQLLN